VQRILQAVQQKTTENERKKKACRKEYVVTAVKRAGARSRGELIHSCH